MKRVHTAKLVAAGIADVAGSFVTRSVSQLRLSFAGIEGDRHYGLTMKAGVRQKHHPLGTIIRNARQLSIVSVEELAQIGGGVDWRHIGANLVVEGLPSLTQAGVGARFVFPSGASVAADAENAPCSKSAREVGMTDFVKLARHKRGLVGWVEAEGIVRVGEEISVWKENE
jgi:MOSC domain-containing protein YiiM